MFLSLRRADVMMGIKRNFTIVLPPLAPMQLPSRIETHLWYVLPDEVKSESLLEQYSELLSPCEKDNVHRMKGEDLKKRALLAHALVRTTNCEITFKELFLLLDQTNSPVDPRSLKFKKNIYGKPEVDWQDDENCCQLPLHFNISHTYSLIACGVTENVPIGLDVEEKQRRIKHDILAFAKRYFTPDEVNFLSTIEDSEAQRQEFIKLWTLKEAYVKALGRGFSAVPFNTFNIQSKALTKGGYGLSEASEIYIESSDDINNHKSNWQFALLKLADSHYAAICTEKYKVSEGSVPMRVIVRKSIPFVEDEFISEWKHP